MRVMVTGGAGYIGSVIAGRLLAAGHEVTVYDNLSRGHRAAVPAGAMFVEGDLRERERLEQAIDSGGCDAVVHLAALAEVAESVIKPRLYADVNTGGTRALIAAAVAKGVKRIVFSSTCSVYGQPEEMPIEENAATRPMNPYGESKLAAERALQEAATTSDGHLSYVAFRYFNACGADGAHGEDHDPESHLVPLALQAARSGRPLRVFGSDYPTADGTCVRDYVHVADLARAHMAALSGPPLNRAINLGTARGNSILEVLASIERVTGRRVPFEMAARRPGDPATLVASYAVAQKLLAWQPERSLDDAVRDAEAWLDTHAAGYAN